MYLEIAVALFALFLIFLIIVILRCRNEAPVSVMRFRSGQPAPNHGVATHINIKINPFYAPARMQV